MLDEKLKMSGRQREQQKEKSKEKKKQEEFREVLWKSHGVCKMEERELPIFSCYKFFIIITKGYFKPVLL